MKLAARLIGDGDKIQEITIDGEALSVGLMLKIPLPDAPLLLLITWEDLRKTIPQALVEFGPKMGASKEVR